MFKDLLHTVWNYFRNESNYEVIEEMSDFCVKFLRLKLTPFVRMEVLRSSLGYVGNNKKFESKFVIVCFFKIKDNGFEMKSYEENEIVLWLLESGFYNVETK